MVLTMGISKDFYPPPGRFSSETKHPDLSLHRFA
jgi:hypothetical protein